MKYRIKLQYSNGQYNMPITDGAWVELEPITEPTKRFADEIEVDGVKYRKIVEPMKTEDCNCNQHTEPTEPKGCKRCGHTEFWFSRSCDESGELEGDVCEQCGQIQSNPVPPNEPYFKPKEQSLEEKLTQGFCIEKADTNKDEWMSCPHPFKLQVDKLAQIAKEHFQQNPEELGLMPINEHNFWVTQKKRLCEGMVSIDTVLEVFDKCFDDLSALDSICGVCYKSVRKALENLKDSK